MSAKRKAIPHPPARVRRLERICWSLELDEFAASIIVDLLERIEALEREFDLKARGRRDLPPPPLTRRRRRPTPP